MRAFDTILPCPRKTRRSIFVRRLHLMNDASQNTEPDDLMESIAQMVRDEHRQRLESDFKEWCSLLEALPTDYTVAPIDGFVVDLELQPMRWMRKGLELLQSSKGTIPIQLFDGTQGPFLDSYLAYPIFQMGAEIFLKGMWLCQFDDCCRMNDRGYLSPVRRRDCDQSLKTFSHDLIKMLDGLRGLSQYRDDAVTMRFLKIVEGVIRRYYWPLYKADRGKEWATSRYPKRFYKDSIKAGNADCLQEFPQQAVIVKLFEPMQDHCDRLWNITPRLRM